MHVLCSGASMDNHTPMEFHGYFFPKNIHVYRIQKMTINKVILEAEPETVHCNFFRDNVFLKRTGRYKPHRRATVKE